MSMSILGGLVQYVEEQGSNDRYNGAPAPRGRKVVYTGNDGTDSDITANHYLKEGIIYTVSEIYVLQSESYVILKEFPLLKFNTVLFEDLETEPVEESQVRAPHPLNCVRLLFRELKEELVTDAPLEIIAEKFKRAKEPTDLLKFLHEEGYSARFLGSRPIMILDFRCK